MKQLLSIEYSKLRKLNSIKVLLIVYMAIIPLWMYFMGFFFDNNKIPFLPDSTTLWSFPKVWSFTTYCASWFNVLLGVTVVIITCNEITFKTMRQNVIDGLTKRQVIVSKFLVILCISAFVTVYTGLVALVFGAINSGLSGMFENMGSVLIYFLQTLGYFSFAFLFSVLVRRPALSIIFFIVSFLVETIIGAFLPHVVYLFFPLNVFSKLTPMPFFRELIEQAEKQSRQTFWMMPEWLNIVLAFVYILIFFTIAYTILKKRDL